MDEKPALLQCWSSVSWLPVSEPMALTACLSSFASVFKALTDSRPHFAGQRPTPEIPGSEYPSEWPSTKEGQEWMQKHSSFLTVRQEYSKLFHSLPEALHFECYPQQSPLRNTMLTSPSFLSLSSFFPSSLPTCFLLVFSASVSGITSQRLQYLPSKAVKNQLLGVLNLRNLSHRLHKTGFSLEEKLFQQQQMF